MTNKHNFSLYQPKPEPRVSAWVWAADIIGGALLIVAIGALTFLAAVLANAAGSL